MQSSSSVNPSKRYILYSTVIVAAVLILIMAAATCIENVRGSGFVAEYVYGSWWFVLLWAIFSGLGIALIIKTKLYRRLPVFLLHVSFVVILCGALVSYLTSERGEVHLRKDEPVTQYDNSSGVRADFGFALTLKDFEIRYYPGTDSPSDYVSHVLTEGEDLAVSMNHIGTHKRFRFTQAGYDSDMGGVRLGVLYDPWGITLTYAGYILLLLSIILVLVSRSSSIRTWYRKALAVASALLFAFQVNAGAANAQSSACPVPDRVIVDDFSRICVLYHGRVCPVSTVADDFVTKLSGKSAWNGYSAMEIFAGWTFNPMEWEKAEIFAIKDKVARKMLGINGKWASYDDFWTREGEYKLKTPLNDAWRDGNQLMLNHLRDADEKFNIIRMFYNGELLKMYPYRNADGQLNWLSPGQRTVEVSLPEGEWMFVRKSMDYISECVASGDNGRASMLLGKIVDYQRLKAGEAIPSECRVHTEQIYGTLSSQRFPVMIYLTVALVLAVLYVSGLWGRVCSWGGAVLALTMLIHISVLLALRWIVSGHVPLSNGFETMQFLSWSVLVVTILTCRKFRIILNFGPLLASFALLVAMKGSGNPQITQLMPVLQSPLLSVHVMVLMFSYALFGLIALISFQGTLLCARSETEKAGALAALSHLLLYPAVFLLCIGIFIGAVWANVSWGRYWSWDPKEVWALITMLVYAAPLHFTSLKKFQSPKFFHLYCLLAFLSVLITYFGVNFLLGGMHSYA